MPLIRMRQLWANKLATAAAAIFAGAAASRALIALHLLDVGRVRGDLATGPDWLQASWDLFTAGAAVAYLALRATQHRDLVGAPLFDDLLQRERMAELEALHTASAGRVEAMAERDAHASMLTALIHNSQSLIYVKDLDGRYLMVDEPFERTFGVREQDLLGQTDEVLDPVLAPVWRANDIRAQQGRYELEEWSDGPDGRHFYESVKFPLFQAAGTVYATCGISLDVTGYRRAVSEIAEARAAAMSAMAKSTFLTTMSHEIRTPMNAVIGLADLLADTRLDAQQREFVDTLRSSGDTLLAVISDILDFSKIESGALELENTEFDLRHAIEGSLDFVVTAATAKGLDLICFVDENCPVRVCGDPVRLRQILANLLSNAIKFTEAGEVLVSARSSVTAEGRLQLTASVADSGIGIPEEGIHRLFRSFSQVDASTTRVYGGTGLGLAISQRLAEAMDGRIDVDSKPGEGTTFTVTVLLDQASDPEDWSHIEATKESLSGKSVLVVDDNATNRQIMDLQLTSLGMICTTVDEAQAAVALVAGGRSYDVAVLDMQMPGMDGAALGTVLHQLPAGRDLPLVLLTSMGSRPTGVHHVFAAFLSKPVKSRGLRDALVTVLSGQTHSSALSPAAHSQHANVAQPLQILLAEDNVVNQRVARLVFRKIGYDIDIVDNGVAAVDAVEAGSYDVVFMDIQMPQMDGLEATRRIRAQVPAARQPCIVAKTANALVEQRDACLAAGMDDYMTKPVRAHELKAMLDKIGSTVTANHVASAAPTPPSERTPLLDAVPARVQPGALDSPIDEAVLEQLMEQVGDEDDDVLDGIIGSYLVEATELVSTLVTAAGEADSAAVGRAAHTLRSSSALLGATGLAGLLERTEHVARTTPQDLTAAAAHIETEYARVEKALVRLSAVAPVPSG